MPISLYDLATYNYIIHGINKLRITGVDSYKVILLLKYNITNYGQLADLIKSGNIELKEPALLMALEHALECLRKINAKKSHDEQYTFDTYSKSNIKSILLKNDMEVKASYLPVKAITNAGYSLEHRIGNISIYDARSLLGLFSLNGRNALISATSDIGPKKATIIANAIKFYEDQILRIADEIPDITTYDKPIFFKDKEEKRKVIIERLPEIIEFFKSHESPCIWDGLQKENPNDKLNKILSQNTGYTKRVIANLIEVLRYYTTITELQQSNLDMTLSRFIKK